LAPEQFNVHFLLAEEELVFVRKILIAATEEATIMKLTLIIMWSFKQVTTIWPPKWDFGACH